MIDVRVELPEKLLFLLSPARHKILYGGRDGVKSWSIARSLLALGTQRPLRILCARETQQSIRESVHQLLSDQVKMMGLEHFYRVIQRSIYGPNDLAAYPLPPHGDKDRCTQTEFIFVGLRQLSVDQIKSFEGIDIIWVEEAHRVTKKSWQTAIPTLRKPGSEIWISFNPDLDTDETYQRWVLHPPPGAKVVRTSYLDNNWLSRESKEEIRLLYATAPDEAEHIYGGATRSTVEGAIYRAEIARAEQEGRITDVPYDQSLPVRTFWDLGWSDLVSIWFAQYSAFQIRIIDYHQDKFQSSDHYLQVLQQRGYTYSQDIAAPAITWPWDAASKMARETMQQSVRDKGFTMHILDRTATHDGIDAVRRMFPQLWFDGTKCAVGLSGEGGKGGLRRYQWGPLPGSGATKREPLHDIASHPADALETLAMAAKATPSPYDYSAIEPAYEPLGSDAWMA